MCNSCNDAKKDSHLRLLDERMTLPGNRRGRRDAPGSQPPILLSDSSWSLYRAARGL